MKNLMAEYMSIYAKVVEVAKSQKRQDVVFNYCLGVFLGMLPAWIVTQEVWILHAIIWFHVVVLVILYLWTVKINLILRRCKKRLKEVEEQYERSRSSGNGSLDGSGESGDKG